VPDWWLDEQAHAGPEHLDPAYVAGYERKAGYDPGPDVSVLLAHGVGRQSTVLDLGAGTGTFSLAISPHVRGVIAVDVSPAMVSALAGRIRAGATPNVTVVQAGFVSYEHDGPPVDAVFTRNALHQLPDFWKGVALDRVSRILRPGGVLRLRDLVYDFDPGEATQRIDAWMAGAVTDPASGWTAAELAEHVRTEHSTYRWLLETLLARTGFEILDASFRRGAYGAYLCRRI
jgi:ubiquinone/menaquinone biosynthesis C-methylase UbiE